MFGTPNYSYSNGYTPWYQQSAPQQPQQPQNNITFAFINGGDAAAENYLMAPNQTIFLIDNEAGKIYIKETNGSGMTVTSRKFKEEKQDTLQQMQSNFVTRDEFERRMKELVSNVPVA